MDSKRILIVEDSSVIRRMLKKLLLRNGYNAVTAENGKAALEILKRDYFPVVVTEMEMPVMDGCELIDEIKCLDMEPVLMVLTSYDKSDIIIEIMRKGVFDYIIKPVREKVLLMKIQQAFMVSELSRIKRITEKEKIIRLERQLEWYRWEERMKNKSNHLNDQYLFKNLYRSLNQGSGFGMLASIIDIISFVAKENGSGYFIDRVIFDQLLENKKMAKKAMNIFSDIVRVISSDIALEQVLINDIYKYIEDIIKEMEGFAKIGKHNIILCDYKSLFKNKSILINPEYFRMVIHEVLLNAMKYSKEKTNIVIILETHDENIVISVINSINLSERENAGVPKEYENIVFEPFFRIVEYIQDNYKSLDFGLGLTLVEKIVQKHNGKISIFNIRDHSNIKKRPETKVNCSISLPLAG